MKDKEKQVEEMAVEDIVKAYPEISRPTAFGIISILKLGYGEPKLPEDSVVFSRDEYKKLQTDMRRLAYQNCNLTIENKNLKENLDIEVFKGKETAEEIILSEIATIKNIRDACVLPAPKYKEGYIDCCNGILFYLKNNLAKQFGVEIKE